MDTEMEMDSNSMQMAPNMKANGKMTKDMAKAKIHFHLEQSMKEPTRKVKDQASENTLGLQESYLLANIRTE